MQKVSGIVVLIFLMLLHGGFTTPAREKINWISFEELEKQYKVNPKPIIIDVYTTWCGWCKVMDNTTYTNPQLSQYVNEKYYAVKLNAETKSSIIFNGKKYSYNPNYRINELTLYLTGGNLSFPHTVLLAGVNAQPAPLPGYLKPRQLEGPIKFYGEKADSTGTYVAFNSKLHKNW